MASERKIDHINYNGEQYDFVDQSARDGVNALSTRVTNLNNAQTQAVNAEKQRAQNAETALQNSKVNVEEGKGLSSNDFTDDYKAWLDAPPAYEGATAMTDGVQGEVPAATKAEKDLYLQANGSWSKPHDTTYNDATQSVHGLMSTEDKIKLDAMDQETDDTVACATTFSNNQITEVLGNGKTKTTTFNNDGSITQTIAKSGMATITLKTVFNADGSITRTRT